MRVSLTVLSSNERDEPGVFHPEERVQSAGKRDCETH